MIQKIFLKADNMKLHIKEQMRKIAYPETKNLKPLSKLIKIKGALKKVKPTLSGNSMILSPSYFDMLTKLLWIL